MTIHDVTRFQVLFVCTGNICRSPTAERLLRHRLREVYGDEAAQVEVTSAGTGAVVGEPIQSHAAALLQQAGVDTSGFVGRDVTEAIAAEADLVLAMTRRHRAEVATLQPSVIARLFTLREFARLVSAEPTHADGDLAARFAALVGVARGRRGLHPVDDPAEDDVPDPYGGPASGYDLPFRLVSDAIDAIIASLK